MTDPKEPALSSAAPAVVKAPSVRVENDFETDTLLSEALGEKDLEKRYDEINVKTMYDMLEEIGDQKLFFLTNRQAELLAESDNSIDKLLGALDMQEEPKLLINLMVEWGFTSANEGWVTEENWGRLAGMEWKRGPFANAQEDIDINARLERFMLEVILPLAERTNALIISSGLQHHTLSGAFNRVLAIRKSKYPGGRPPFSVLSFVENLHEVVANQSDEAHWKKILRGSTAWKKRHKLFASGVQEHLDWQRYDRYLNKTETAEQKEARKAREGNKPWKTIRAMRFSEPAFKEKATEWQACPFEWQQFDLSDSTPCIILVDTINSSFEGAACTADDVIVRGPTIQLMNTLIKRVANVLPSISLQTGGSIFERVRRQGAYRRLWWYCLDTEPRTSLSSGSRHRLAAALHTAHPSASHCVDCQVGNAEHRQPGSLFRSVDMINNGIPVLFLDVVKRPTLSMQSGSRALLIEMAKRKYIEHQDRLFAAGVVDTFNHCTLAYFFDVLYGDGDSRTTEQRATNGAGRGGPVPIHVALRRQRRAHRRGGQDDEGAAVGDVFSFDPASPEQVDEVSRWLTTVRHDYILRFRKKKFENKENRQSWELPEGLEYDPSKPEYYEKTLPHKELFGHNMPAEELAYRTLLLDDKFNACHVDDIAGAKLLVDTLCRTSRLPRENTVEALELLQRAWSQHDVALHLAHFYKRLGRLLYMLYILVGQATIAATAVFFALGFAPTTDSATTEDTNVMQYTLFGLSMAGSLVLIADRFFNPTQRGGQLRAGAAQLESIIWRFRTRIGQFAVPQGNSAPKGPDYALRNAMVTWHEDLTAGTDLLSTALDKNYPAKVYVHGQLSGPLPPATRRGKRAAQRVAAADKRKTAQVEKLDRQLEKMHSEFWPEYFGPKPTKDLPPALKGMMAKDPLTKKLLQQAEARRGTMTGRGPGTAASVAPAPTPPPTPPPDSVIADVGAASGVRSRIDTFAAEAACVAEMEAEPD